MKDSIADLADVPFEYFHPLGVMRLVPLDAWKWICTAQVLQTWNVLMLVLLALCALGIRPYRPIAILTCTLMTMYLGVILSFRYLAHPELPSLYTCYLLALFPTADGFSLQRGKKWFAPPAVYRAAMQTAAAMFCVTYMFVGVRRLFVGGLDIFLNGTILNYIAHRSAEPGYLEEAYGLWVLESPLLSQSMLIGFAIVTFFEIFSLLCLRFPWFRRCWLVVILSFHVLCWPLMQLLFLHNIMLNMVLMTDIHGIVSAADRWIAQVTCTLKTRYRPNAT